MSSSYETYIRAEWDLFIKNPDRYSDVLNEMKGRPVKAVLDAGCGAGQELLPFVKDLKALGVGMDISPEVGEVGRKLFSEIAPHGRIQFVQASAEQIPFLSQTFDVVVCRLALPYTNNPKTIAEFARVLKSKGSLFLKIHHFRYYCRQVIKGLKIGNIRSVVHGLRVICCGGIYFLTGHQPFYKIFGRETFQTEGMLKREFSRHGLILQRVLPDSNPYTPAFKVYKS